MTDTRPEQQGPEPMLRDAFRPRGAPLDRPVFEVVAIVGVGLIGGSLGMAARKNGLAKRVVGVGRSEPKLMRAKILGAIDDYSLDLEGGAADADLVVICTPVRTVVPMIERMASKLKNGAVVTDVGSTKRVIVEEADKTVPDGISFVGGHPMTGSEKTGVEHAEPGLFVDSTYVVTHSDSTNVTALGKMTAFAEGLGARVEVMSPEEHDQAVAVISHLPHAISAALLLLAEKAQRHSGKAFRLAAGSFRDLTRISDSPPEIWTDICSTNAESLADSVTALCRQLQKLTDSLAAEDDDAVRGFFEEARQIRQTYLRIAK